MTDLKKIFTNDNFISNELPADILPQSLDLEESILGALILEKDSLSSVIDILKLDSFYKNSHKEIYRAILNLFDKSEGIDLHTVINQLRKNGKLESIGGSCYLVELTTKVSSINNIEFHAMAIVEYSIKRSLISIAAEIKKNSYNDEIDVFILLDRFEQALFEISDLNIKKSYSNIKPIIVNSFKDIELRRKNKDFLTGIPSGFSALDCITLG
jgi:replicative DNA helicase